MQYNANIYNIMQVYHTSFFTYKNDPEERIIIAHQDIHNHILERESQIADPPSSTMGPMGPSESTMG